ncbi:hypothetical protein D3C80_1944930 [compost metagenome]
MLRPLMELSVQQQIDLLGRKRQVTAIEFEQVTVEQQPRPMAGRPSPTANPPVDMSTAVQQQRIEQRIEA